MTFTPDGKQIYVSNAANNSVTAIDTAAMKINAVIPVGQAPKRVGTVVHPLNRLFARAVLTQDGKGGRPSLRLGKTTLIGRDEPRHVK